MSFCLCCSDYPCVSLYMIIPLSVALYIHLRVTLYPRTPRGICLSILLHIRWLTEGSPQCASVSPLNVAQETPFFFQQSMFLRGEEEKREEIGGWEIRELEKIWWPH